MADTNIATVTKYGLLSCQVCVPKTFTDKQAKEFVEKEYPCGTSGGWFMRTDPEKLAGDPVRNQCVKYTDNVHITFDA